MKQAPIETKEIEELILSNLTLPRRVFIKHFAHRVPTTFHEDLIQEGHVALVKAAQSFDTNRNVPFASFAAIKIRGRILDYLRTAARSNKRLYIVPLLEQDFSYLDDTELIEIIPPCRTILAGFSLRDKKALSLYFSTELSVREVAESMGITASRFSQIKSEFSKRVREELELASS